MRDILVHIDDCDLFAPLYATAMATLAPLDARVRVLWIDNPPALPAFIRAQMGEGFESWQRKMAAERRDAAHGAFLAAPQGAEWVEMHGEPARVAARLGRCCDLIVVAQPDWHGGAQAGEAHVGEDLLFASGRPVLFLPRPRPGVPAGQGLGRRIVIAWNDSPQAARAVHDAVPFLTRAEHVALIGDIAGSDVEIVAHLRRLGVAVTAGTAPGSGADPATAILDFCDAQRADLVVMGAYGHSRLREYVLGGVTRQMLKRQGFGVLMAH